MGNLYTLVSVIEGKESLNGKVFKVKCRGVGSSSAFIDVTSGAVIWETTDVISIEKWNHDDMNGIILTTQNTVYRLLNVLSIVPTRNSIKPTD